MSILGLGYITIKSDKLSDWTDFSSNYLGMQLVDKTKSTAILRMDDRKQRLKSLIMLQNKDVLNQ